MSIERMADRSLPLAERVKMAIDDYPCWPGADDPKALALLTELLADAAAADRLARAYVAHDDAYSAYSVAFDQGVSLNDPRSYAYDAACEERDAADAAYRARMAQGVTHG